MGDEVKTAAEAYEAAALPRMHEVHTDPDQPKSGDQPLPKSVTDKSVKQKSPAQWAYERVVLYLKNFEEKLDNDHEAAIGFAGGDAGVLRIEGMGYFDPDIITFYGVDPAGARAQLVQHVGQLNVMLRALPKKAPDAEPKRIGFRLVADLEKT
ncbi:MULTISPECIES: DUF6173 family protein [Sulfitobacter]|mgnify:FL=1|jgi:hypothetical protein|uniref:Uncharacterized protein n=1 Tax=Sulfitobacter dubius TaxID=218673 RepID=A0ABY3ZGQ7_9RHOB|nr:DUF6173 family protein [Sulfitobacter dubius]UOA13825.1 hypothetical protein DSM109990_00618 [Sulfitobacter dubius]WOI27673.1 DUF6173 family protein [Sulfitobacter dubius]|tara:strand:+ start:241 stop:699 length:459 start_codon:yes stop_codon:yes gene_type:complete